MFDPWFLIFSTWPLQDALGWEEGTSINRSVRVGSRAAAAGVGQEAGGKRLTEGEGDAP